MKPVFQVLFALIVATAIGALALSFSIDGIVKSNIESTTSEMLDTSVDVDNVAISILDGSGTIDGFTIHNPEGFTDKPAVKLQQIKMQLDLYSLLSDTVVVKEIHIQKPELFFEQKGVSNNLNALTDKLGGDTSSEVNLVVDRLLVENGSVTLTADIGKEEKTLVAEFSQIEIEGIGRDGNNTMEQAMQQMLEPILQKAVQQAIKEGLLDAAKEKLKDLING